MSAARGDRRATAAGGIVLVESGELAQAARARGADRVVNGEARGPKRQEKSPLAERVRELERDNTRLKQRAERAEGIVELQKSLGDFAIELEKRVETD